MDIEAVDLTLREFTMSDIPAILAIEQDLFADPWSSDIFTTEIIQSEQFFKEVKGKQQKTKHNYVLEYRGEIVGFFLGWAIYDEYSIMNIGVSKSFQNKGLGSFIMSKMLERALDLECFTIYLEVRVSNLPAIRLYEKYRFEQVGVRKNYYPDPLEDALVMKLDLVDHEIMMDSLFKSIIEM